MNMLSTQNILILSSLFLCLFLGFYFFYNTNKKSEDILWEGYSTVEKEVEGKKMTLVIARTQKEWQKGLMNVRKPFAYDGMIFKSNISSPQVFWNKNTFEDLDIYWLKNEKVIGKSFLPSIEKAGLKTVSSPGLADTVIEVIR